MKKSAKINEAFQNIRNATGLTDVQEIVDKFLKREETYSELLKAVTNYEIKIDSLKRDNDAAMDELHDMILKDTNSASDPELASLENKRENLSKDLEESNERSQRIEIVKDLIYGWAQKVLKRMDDIFQTSGSLAYDMEKLDKLKSETDLESLFNSITDIVVSQLEQINRDEGGEDKPLIHQSFMNDFASQQYVERNIRVRPSSGRQDDGDRKAVQSGYIEGDGDNV